MAKTRKDVRQRQGTMSKYVKIDKSQKEKLGRKPTLKKYEYPDDVETYDELRKVYLKLAQTADDRIRDIENIYSKREGYEDIIKFAYAKAMEDISAYRGEDSRRFKGGVPKEGNILTLRSRINDVLKFLNSPSSTITGINLIYESRAKTLNDKYGLNLTWKDMGDFFENDVVQKTIGEFASDTAMKVIGKYRRNEEEIHKLFEDYEKNKTKIGEIGRFKSENTKTTLTAKQMRYLFENRDKLSELTEKLGK